MDDIAVASLKRAGAALAGVAIIALNKKFGLGLGDVDIGAISSILLTYLLQSVWHSNKKLQADAQATAEASVKSSKDAAVVFNSTKVPVLVLLLAALAFPRVARADELPADAPRVQAVAVTAGYVTPAPGTFLPEPLDLEQARRIVACETERNALRTQGPPLWAVLAAVAGGALLGGGAVLYFKK